MQTFMKQKILEIINNYSSYQYKSFNSVNEKGQNPLLFFIDIKLMNKTDLISSEDVDYLLNHSELNHIDNQQENVLHYYIKFLASIYSEKEKVFNEQQLLKLCTSKILNQTNHENQTPLIMLCNYKFNQSFLIKPSDQVISKILLNTNLNIQSSDGHTALNYFFINNHKNLFDYQQKRYLIKNSDLNLLNKNANSLFYFLSYGKGNLLEPDLIDYLIANSKVQNDNYYALPIYFSANNHQSLQPYQIENIIKKTDFTYLTKTAIKNNNFRPFCPLSAYFRNYQKNIYSQFIDFFIANTNINYLDNPEAFLSYLRSSHSWLNNHQIDLLFNKAFYFEKNEDFNLINTTPALILFFTEFKPYQNMKLYDHQVKFLINHAFKTKEDCYSLLDKLNKRSIEKDFNIKAITRYLNWCDLNQIYQKAIEHCQHCDTPSIKVKLNKQFAIYWEELIIKQNINQPDKTNKKTNKI